jgi:hypothetical protein
MARGIDLSTLSSLSNDATLAARAKIESSEHNTHRSGRRSLVNNLLTGMLDAESMYAGSGEPTDKPQGKVFYDTSATAWKGYKTASGTPVALLDASTAYAQDLSTAGTATFRVGGVINNDTTQVALSTTGVLESYTLPAGTLARDGQYVKITMWGTKTNANADASIQIRFNSGVQHTFTLDDNADEWLIEWWIVRTGAATQKFAAMMKMDRDDTGKTDLVGIGTDAETLANALSIDANLSSVNASDTVTKEVMIVELGNY